MEISPYAFINNDDSENERARLDPQETQSTAQKIDGILNEMGMSKEDLVELIQTLLGLGQDVASIEEGQLTIKNDDEARTLDNLYSPEDLLELMGQLEVLQRLRILQRNGEGIEISELEALIGASKKLDKKTLQVIMTQHDQITKRMLNKSELGNMRDLLTRAEYASVVAGTIASSGGSDVQQRVLTNLSQQFLPKNKQFELNKGKQLTIKNQETTQKQSKDTLATLIREDVRMDMKRLVDATRTAVGKVLSEMRTAQKKADPNKNRAADDNDKKRALEQEHGQEHEIEQGSLTKSKADKELDKTKQVVHQIDYADDMRRAMKAAKDGFKKLLGGGKAGKKEAWAKDSEKREKAVEEKELTSLDNERETDESGIVMDKKGATQETEKDQKKLIQIDTETDRQTLVKQEIKAKKFDLQKMASQSKHGLANSAMQKAQADIGKLGSKEALQAAAADMAKGVAKMGKVSDASMDNLSDSLDKVKDHKQDHDREIGK